MPPRILVIGGSDPTGGAGVQADTKAAALFGVHTCTVVTCCTSQNTREFKAVRPLPPEDVLDQMDVLLSDMSFDVVKTGLLGSCEIMEALGERLRSARLVVDPVLSFTTGGSLPQEIVEAYKKHILPHAWLVTPNLDEARLLAGREDCGRPLAEAVRRLMGTSAGSVVITGGHGDPRTVDVVLSENGWSKFKSPRLEGKYHGTGCSFASMVAACTVLGQPLAEAVARSKRMLYNRMLMDYRPGGGVGLVDLVSPLEDVVHEVDTAARRFCSAVPAAMVPEVGTNIAYALPHAFTYEDVAGLEGRIVRGSDAPMRAGCAGLGKARHTARIVLAAMSHDPSKRCAVNIRYSQDVIDQAVSLGLVVGTFSRESEPAGSQSMEWGTLKAIEDAGRVPDVIYDVGGVGKEPMLRIISRTPKDALDIIESLKPGHRGNR